MNIQMEEKHGVRLRKGRGASLLSAGAPSLLSTGALLSTSTCPQLRVSPTPTFGTLVEASSHGCDRSLTAFTVPFPFPEDRGWGCKSPVSNQGLFFLNQSPSPSLPSFASLERQMLLSARKFQGIQELCARN